MGVHVDYPSYRLGLSQASADWLAGWISATLELDGWELTQGTDTRKARWFAEEPWEENQEADVLSSMKVGGFFPDLRIRAGPDTVKFLVLDGLLEASVKLHEQLARERETRAAGGGNPMAGVRIKKHRKVLSAG